MRIEEKMEEAVLSSLFSGHTAWSTETVEKARALRKARAELGLANAKLERSKRRLLELRKSRDDAQREAFELRSFLDRRSAEEKAAALKQKEELKKRRRRLRERMHAKRQVVEAAVAPPALWCEGDEESRAACELVRLPAVQVSESEKDKTSARAGKLAAHVELCPFELHGRCNDVTCTFRHLRDVGIGQMDLNNAARRGKKRKRIRDKIRSGKRTSSKSGSAIMGKVSAAREEEIQLREQADKKDKEGRYLGDEESFGTFVPLS